MDTILLSNEIVLIRGLPGTGKSTMAKKMNGHIHLEADMFLEVNGVYVYDSAKVPAAHDWCVASAKSALEQGQSVVVSNTFVQIWELERYINLKFPYRIIELHQIWPNIHNVSQDRIKIMGQRWEKLPGKYRNSSAV